MTLAAILERAKAVVAGAPVVISDELELGAEIEHEVFGAKTPGAFLFLDGDWVHWVDDAGVCHASPRRAITRLR